MWPVKFSGINPLIERKHLYAYFHHFGTILKLFLKEDKSSATIYFDNAESAEKAFAALLQPNIYNFCAEELDIKPPFPVRDTLHFATPKKMEEFGSDLAYMFDILGNKIPTLSGDDDKIYVAIDDLERSGFRLFPAKPNKFVYTTRIQEYVQMYLKIQMFKFATKYHISLNEDDKNRIISSVSDDVQDKIDQNCQNSMNDDQNTPLRRPKDMGTSAVMSDAKSPLNISLAVSNSPSSYTSPTICPSTVDLQQQEIEPSIGGGTNVNGYMQQDRSHESISCNTGFDKRRSEDSLSQHSSESKGNNYIKARNTSCEKRRSDETMSQTSTGSDLSKRVSKSITVPLNRQLTVYVNRILENNAKIAYVQLTSNREILERIDRDVNKEAVNSQNVSPSDGLICAVMHNSIWKRVIIRSLVPLRGELIDYGLVLKLPEGTIFRALSEALQAEPWLCVRVCKTNECDMILEKHATYKAIAAKVFEDGTYVLQFLLKVANDDSGPKKEMSPRTAANPKQNFESMDLLPAGANLSKPAPSASKSATSVLKAPTAFLASKATSTIPDDSFQHPTILNKLHEGMEVMVEFHHETYSQGNNVVAFIYIKDNEEQLDELDKITTIDSNHFSSFNDISSIKIGDLVGIQSSIGENVERCIIYNIKNGIYSVAKVDAGTVESVTVESIKQLHDDVKKVPFLSCVCTYPDLDDLTDAIDAFKVNAKKQLCYKGPTCNIQGISLKPWNPLVTHGGFKANPVAERQNKPEPVKYSAISVPAAPSSITVRVGDVIRIINVDFPSCTFFCQTREMYTYYNKEILENIRSLAEGARPIQNPMENQFAIVKVGAVFYRGVVDKVISQRVSVKMIDIGGYTDVPLQNIFHIDQTFSKKRNGCTQITLDGLQSLEDDAIAFLKICMQNKDKFTITAINESSVSMKDSTGNNLLNRLSKMTNKPPGFWYKNLKHVNIPNGNTALFFSYVNIENGDVYFTVNDSDLRARFAELLTEIPEYCEAAPIYHPSKGEICYAYCLDDWCRAHVLSANKDADEYFVFFIDFGNCENIKSEFIRCLPDESYGSIPPLCNKFIIQDLKKMYCEKLPHSIGLQLEQALIMGEEYEINVLKKLENNTYEAKIPKITAFLKNRATDEF